MSSLVSIRGAFVSPYRDRVADMEDVATNAGDRLPRRNDAGESGSQVKGSLLATLYVQAGNRTDVAGASEVGSGGTKTRLKVTLR